MVVKPCCLSIADDVYRIDPFQTSHHLQNKPGSNAPALVSRKYFQERNVGMEDPIGKCVNESYAVLIIQRQPDFVTCLKDLQVASGVRRIWPAIKEALKVFSCYRVQVVSVGNFNKTKEEVYLLLSILLVLLD